MPQSFTRRTLSALALALSVAVASLTLSAAAFAQDPTTEPLNPYTSTTPTVPPTTEEAPATTSDTLPAPPPPTAEPEPTATEDAAPPAPTAATAATPNTPPKKLAFTGYDPLIVGFAGLILMLGAVALQRRRGTN